MEHFIGISIWIVTFFTCLQARYLPIVDANIDNMRDSVTCLPNSTFYAPTDVTVECIPTALDCVMRELNGTVTQECDDHFGYIDQAVVYFEFMTLGRAQTKPGECECERWSQTSFREFLNKTQWLLELKYATSVQ